MPPGSSSKREKTKIPLIPFSLELETHHELELGIRVLEIEKTIETKRIDVKLGLKRRS